ncbi:MAG: NYN domain-containing protein [Segetibacter sp.]
MLNSETPQKKERVIAYIDGFNLYFGMKQGKWNDLLWLNVQQLAASLLQPHQQLQKTKYFTSRVRNHPEKEKRQNTYLEVLETVADLKIYYGQYQSHVEECRRCGNTYPYANEKMTDVNIATELLTDAFRDQYDTALLITGDSDLVPPIKAVHNNFKNKRVLVGFPPNRFNLNVKNAARGSFMIGRKKLKDAQFPLEIAKLNGFLLKRPETWM